MVKYKKSLKSELEPKFTVKFQPISKILAGITIKSIKNPNAVFNDLYSLLSSVPLLVQALGNIRANKGMSTPGTNKETLDEPSMPEGHRQPSMPEGHRQMNMKKIIKISESIKNGTFKFSPSRRIYIPKPGKKKLRPLSIPNLTDKIVQEAIKIILQAIYEPIFSKHKFQNYGFRPQKSCHTAIMAIKKTATTDKYAIEGDIVGAYDNVNINKLIKILGKRIHDRKFLNFIEQNCRTGYIHKGLYKDSLLGVTQGGIASPILFNIYMNEFDTYINNHLTKVINKYNKLHKRLYDRPPNPEYKKIQGKIEYNAKQLSYRALTPYKFLTPTRHNTIDKYRKRKNEPSMPEGHRQPSMPEGHRQLNKLRLKTPSTLLSRTPVRIAYYRYADNWIIFTNGKLKLTQEIKNHVAKWLKSNLDFELSQEKTKITNLRSDFARFLGFTIKLPRTYKTSRNKIT